MSNSGLFKLLADETRLKILNALSEKDMYVELLAERLQLSAPTVSFHLKKLHAAGLVDARREQYYIIYSIHKSAFEMSLSSLVFGLKEEELTGRMREEQYRRKVINTFMPNGFCETMPSQVKKKMIIYEEIFSHFESDRAYTEREVNTIIAGMHADFCTVRRTFIGLGWMRRENGIYTIIGVQP